MVDPDAWRPSVKLRDLMTGKTAWSDADKSIRSMASLHIYNAAKMVLAEKSKDRRRKMLAKIPGTIRPEVEKEVLRLWRS